MISAHKGHLQVAKCLVEHGADVNARDQDGITALFWAKLKNKNDVTRFLQERKREVKRAGNQEIPLVEDASRQTRSEGASSVGLQGRLVSHRTTQTVAYMF